MFPPRPRSVATAAAKGRHALRAAVKDLRGTSHLTDQGLPVSFWDLPPEQALRVAYNVVLRRDPDPAGREHLLGELERGRALNDVVDVLRGSDEYFTKVPFSELAPSLHLSRCQFIRSLPRGRRIIDLGGTHKVLAEGALVSLGYPYAFDELVVVDLPPEERHELYSESRRLDTVASDRGVVRYEYHSMVDLTGYESDSFDLVYAGQSIEHVTVAEARHVCSEVSRILKPGGHFALDTPNAAITRLQQPDFIDPDHDHEYHLEELVALVSDAGFTVAEVKGLNYMGAGAARREFDPSEVAANCGVFAEAGDCYVLALVCQKP